MATWGDAWWRMRESVRLVTTERTNFENGTAGSGYRGDEAAIAADGVQFDTDIERVYRDGLAAVRATFSNAISPGVFRQVMDPCLIQLSRAMGKPQTDPLAVLPILYDYMSLNTGGFFSAPAVDSRNINYGTWTAAAGNVGNGEFVQLTVDQYGNKLESGYCEPLAFQCFADYQSGTNPGQEQFNVQGAPVRDNIQRYQAGYGSGINAPTGTITGISGDTTQSLVLNPSFSDFSGAGATFNLNNWTLSAGLPASMSVVTGAGNIYRASAIESTAGALKVTANVTLTQTLATRAGSLGATLAYFTQIAANFSLGTGVGTVQVQIGNLTYSLSNGASVAGWNKVRPTLDKNLYFYNFNTNNLTITLTITCSSGYILVDDFLWAPFVNVGGFSFAAVGGATNWRFYDSGTITNTEGSGKMFQRAFSEAYGWSLPSRILATRPTAPTLATGGAGAVAAGRHGVCVTFVTGGVEGPPSIPVFISCDGAHQISVTNIAIGPGGTTARELYFTSADGKAFYRVQAIGDNTTTAASINNADGTFETLANTLGPIHDVMS